MKRRRFLLSLALILFFHISHAQLLMIDGETGEYRYEEVVKAEGLSQSQIKNRAKKWMSLYYKPIDSVRVDSMGLQQMSSFETSWKFIKKTIPLEIYFDLTIKSKDNRYKYDFANFKTGKMVLGKPDVIDLKTYITRFPEKYQIYVEEPIDNEISKAISSLEYFIINDKLKVEEDDW